MKQCKVYYTHTDSLQDTSTVWKHWQPISKFEKYRITSKLHQHISNKEFRNCLQLFIKNRKQNEIQNVLGK
jgi:hypothetical protein